MGSQIHNEYAILGHQNWETTQLPANAAEATTAGWSTHAHRRSGFTQEMVYIYRDIDARALTATTSDL